ncbi:MAG: uroporphyrinogen-III synthase [Halieaceae bacterium]|nr:uroporphyrinogen-III synthase [Halieaceae bacterium]
MAGTSVLVTRPEGQARELGERIAAAGFRPVYAPLMAIEAFPEPSTEQRQLLLDLCHFEHVIFVSRNAIRHGMAWIEDFWPQLPAGIQWYTVGSSSAAALAAYGIDVRQPESDMTSEGLLALRSLSAVQGQRVLIVKGEGGRAHLRETLQARGARVEELEVYRRSRPAYGPGELAQRMASGEVRVVLLSSGEALDNMVSLLGTSGLERASQCTLVAPGARVAAAASAAGFTRVVEAQNATDDAMLAALCALPGLASN